MKENIKLGTYFIFTTATVILSIFLLSLSKINLTDFLTINIFSLLEKTMTIEFVAFLFLIPIILTSYYFMSKIFVNKKNILIINSSWILGILIGTIVFGKLDFILVFLVSTIGVFLLTNEKEKESYLSTGFSFSKKFTIFFSIGLFLTILSVTLPNASEFEKNFSTDILNTTIGSEDETMRDMIESPLIDSIILTQEQTIKSIKNLQSYKALKQSPDADVQLFIKQLRIMQDTISSKEYKKQIENQLDSTQGISDQITHELPIINNLAKFSWILYPIFALILSISIFGVIIQIITAILYATIKKIVKSYKK